MIQRSPLRWVGGKWHWREPLRRLAESSGRRTYCEPFLGGAGSLIAVGPERFVAADTNAPLVRFYDQCAESADDVLDCALSWPDDRDTYGDVRSLCPAVGSVEEAGRFLYLNRTAFLGLYRVNQCGVFNVPYGGGGRLLVSSLSCRMRALAQLLNRGEVFCSDFEVVLDKLRGDELLLCDPPYSVGSDRPFGRYGTDVFTWSDHYRLGERARMLEAAGLDIAMCIPFTVGLLGPYSAWFVLAERNSASQPAGELLIICPSLARRLGGGLTGRLSRVGRRLRNGKGS